jgi:hypothetical protein
VPARCREIIIRIHVVFEHRLTNLLLPLIHVTYEYSEYI